MPLAKQQGQQSFKCHCSMCVHAATLDAESHSTDRVHWIFKNKDQGKTAATASLGMVTLWDVEGGLPQIDKFLYSKDNYVVAGPLLP